jgi:predicted transcriptional regulator
MSITRKFYTGVGLDPEVVQFLADLSQQTQRTRSWLINAIILDQAQRLRLEQEAKAAEFSRNQPPVIQI